MRNVEWITLSDGERGQLVAMWLLAADRDGVIPASPDLIQKICFMSEPPNINKFMGLGFIDAKTTPRRRPHDQPEAKAEEEENKDIQQKKNFYLTRKGRKLNNKRLNSFNLFWDAFNYKKGRAEAADSWLDIPTLTDSLVDIILKAAKTEALNRQKIIKEGRIPKMAQGWLSGKRWEDETQANQKKILTGKEAMEWEGS